MKNLMIALAMMAGVAFAGSGVMAQNTPSPKDAKVYFIGLEDGATVKSPVTIHFGLKGMGVAPAGVEMENTGHHHLLVNSELTGEELNEPIPADDNHVHFGGGQTETTIELEPGEHTLQLVLGDWSHFPHDPPVMSERISITVEE